MSMFLPYGFFKADETLSCKAGVGQARCARSNIRKNETRTTAPYRRALFSLSLLTYGPLGTQVLRLSKNISGSVTTVNVSTVFQKVLLTASIKLKGRGFDHSFDSKEISCHRAVLG